MSVKLGWALKPAERVCDMNFELVLGLIFLFSSFTLGFAGFGFALISVPLLTLLMPVQNAVTIQVPFSIMLFTYSAWHYRHHFSWKYVRPLVFGTMFGLSLGNVLLLNLPESLLQKTLAAFIALVVALKILPVSNLVTKHISQGHWWGIFWGFLSGSFFGAYTIGGPTAAVYIMSSTSDPFKAKSFLAFYFSGLFILAAFIYAATGVLTWQYFNLWFMFTPIVIIGFFAGLWAFARVSNLIYRRAVDVLLLFAAILLWLR